MKTNGPILTDYNGILREPIWVCINGESSCKHFSIHESHYFYCAAQPIEGQTYPASDAGKQLAEARPDSSCPWAQTIKKYIGVMGQHFMDLGLHEKDESLAVAAQAMVNEKRTEALKAQLCPKCGEVALVKMDGCLTCTAFGESKCS